jgi:hypothetical protein
MELEGTIQILKTMAFIVIGIPWIIGMCNIAKWISNIF